MKANSIQNSLFTRLMGLSSPSTLLSRIAKTFPSCQCCPYRTIKDPKNSKSYILPTIASCPMYIQSMKCVSSRYQGRPRVSWDFPNSPTHSTSHPRSVCPLTTRMPRDFPNSPTHSTSHPRSMCPLTTRDHLRDFPNSPTHCT